MAIYNNDNRIELTDVDSVEFARNYFYPSQEYIRERNERINYSQNMTSRVIEDGFEVAFDGEDLSYLDELLGITKENDVIECNYDNKQKYEIDNFNYLFELSLNTSVA